MTDKINAAYALGGPTLSVQTSEPAAHPDQPRRQRELRRLPARGRTGSAASTSTSTATTSTTTTRRSAAPFDYATINIKPGYQKLCGQDALDYVRYRHFDDDLVRAARQQDFLRQAKDQIGLGRIFGDRKELLRIFGRYTQTDIRAEHAAILRLLKLAFESSKNPIREVHFRGDIGDDVRDDLADATSQRTSTSSSTRHGLERPARDRRRAGASKASQPPARAARRPACRAA